MNHLSKYKCHPIKNLVKAYQLSTEILAFMTGLIFVILVCLLLTKRFRPNICWGDVESPIQRLNENEASSRQSPVSLQLAFIN